jgi:transposase-like protein
MGRRGYPSEFRRKVVDLVEAGRSIADVARDLGISQWSIYTWRGQARIDRGLVLRCLPPRRGPSPATNRRDEAVIRTTNFAPDGSRRPAQTQLRTTVGRHLLARRCSDPTQSSLPRRGCAATKSTLLGGLRSPATWGNAGPHSGKCKIHGKDGVAGSIPAGGST